MEVEEMIGKIIEGTDFRQECGEQRYRNRSVSQDHDRSR